MKVVKKSLFLGKWIFGILFLYFIFERLDVLFLSRYLKFELIGIYSVAIQFTMIFSLMQGSIYGVFLPKASVALASKEAFRTYIKESFMAIAMINMLVVLLIIFAPIGVKVLYGPAYVLAGSLLRVLLVGIFFAVIFLPFSFLFYAMDDAITRFFLESLKIIIGILGLFLLVPKFNLMGGAMAISIALVLNTFISMLFLRCRLIKRYNFVLN